MGEPDRKLPLCSTTRNPGGVAHQIAHSRPTERRGEERSILGGRTENAVFAQPDAATPRLAAASGHPILASIPEARWHFGDTAFYTAVKRYHIKLVRLGGRSLVPMAEIERVVGELMSANRPPEFEQNARALASRSVAARRRRRRTTTP
jgi:hypothetical protein